MTRCQPNSRRTMISSDRVFARVSITARSPPRPSYIGSMPLTLRPTGLQTSAAFAHLADWSVYDDGRQIGRLREEHAPPRPERAWYWSITVLGPGPRTGAHRGQCGNPRGGQG